MTCHAVDLWHMKQWFFRGHFICGIGPNWAGFWGGYLFSGKGIIFLNNYFTLDGLQVNCSMLWEV